MKDRPSKVRSYMAQRSAKKVAAVVLSLAVVAGAMYGGVRLYSELTTTSVTAYFTSTNGIFVGDDVKILGVSVGKIDQIVPEGPQVKVDFHYDSKYKVPNDAKAVILSQSLVSARAIQLTPAHTDGPALADGASIPVERTAVPVEWDDFRKQLERLADSLGPTETSQTGPLGEFISSTADTLAGKGDSINETLSNLSEAMKTVSDGRQDLFAVVRNLQVFVSALAGSEQQIVQINNRLASVTSVMTNSDRELSGALQDIDSVTDDLQRFIADNRGGVQHSLDRLASVTTALNDVRPDIEQLLHVAPTALANFYNIYQPAQGALTGALAVTQFQNPVQFVCGAIQSASQLGAEESAKLCAQYLGPVLQTLQFNYPPFGANPIAGVQARPDQVDYSEDWLRDTLGVTSSASRNAVSVGAGSGLAGLLGQIPILGAVGTPAPQSGGR